MTIVNNNYILETAFQLRRLVERMQEVCSRKPTLDDVTDPSDVLADADAICSKLKAVLPQAQLQIEIVEVDEQVDPRSLRFDADHPYTRESGLEQFGAVYFEVTERHLEAISRLSIYRIPAFYYQDIHVPCVQRMRPFGNSGIYDDLAEILGIKLDHEDEIPPETIKRLINFADEVVTALQVCTRTLSFKPGRYKAVSVLRDYWIEAENSEGTDRCGKK